MVLMYLLMPLKSVVYASRTNQIMICQFLGIQLKSQQSQSSKETKN